METRIASPRKDKAPAGLFLSGKPPEKVRLVQIV
jgi:hypothetical protein